jgi:peptidyl-prolyl cis-trans isomerase D
MIILVSLVLFVVSDYFSSKSKFGFGGTQNVGEIAGTSISVLEFDAKYKELLAQLNSNGSGETEQTKEQASSYAWNQFVQTLIVDKEYASLGLDISVAEAGKLLYSDDAHSTIKQYFSKDGQFSPSNVINFKNQVAKKDPKMMAQFELILKQVFMEVQSRKYNSLVAKSLYATNLDAEDDYFASTLNYNGKSVTLNYATVDDKSIKIEDSDLKDYIKRHKDEFKQKASRDLDYILINVSPSKADTLEVRNALASEINEFKDAEVDSVYVQLNSTVPYSDLFQSHGSFNKAYESKLFSAPKDSVIGPIYYDRGFSLFKVLDKKSDSVTYYHAIRVELAIKGSTKDDTLKAIANGKKLGAESNSSSNSLEFFNSKVNTGEVTYAQDLGWVREGSQDEQVNKAVKTLGMGQSTVVKSMYGLSLIKLVDPKSSELIKIGEVRKPIEALKSTEDEAYQKASNFRSSLSGDNKDEFEKQVKKNNLVKSIANNVKESDRAMTGIPGTIDVVRWAFDDKRELGDYSDVISAGDLLIVAKLSKIKKEGTSDVEDVREKVTRLVMDEKKAKILVKQFEDGMKKSKTIEDLATNVKSMVQPFYNTNFYSTNVQFAGNDLKLVGYVCGLKTNTMSRPITSNDGVHVVLVEGVSKVDVPKDLSSRKKILYDQKKQQVYNSVFEALKKAADVKDERYKFY